MSKLLPDAEPQDISISEFNRHVEASDWYHARKALGEPKPPALGQADPTDVVHVRTGVALPRGSVVELGERIVDELDPRYLWYQVVGGVNPENYWAITRGQIAADTIGEAQVAGVCIARVRVLDIEHRFARVVQGSRVLESAGSGPVRLVQLAEEVDEEEEEQELVVQLRYEPRVEVVELTSLEKSGDFYPGKLKHYDPQTNTWSDVRDVWIVDANE